MGGDNTHYDEHHVLDGPITKRLARAMMQLQEGGGRNLDQVQSIARSLGVSEDVVQDPDQLRRVVIKRDQSE